MAEINVSSAIGTERIMSTHTATAVAFNPLAWKFNILVDFSSSMLKAVRPGCSRHTQAKELVVGLVAELNSLGVPEVDIYRFNNGECAHVPGVKNTEEAEAALAFRVVGGTPLDLALDVAFRMEGGDQKNAYVVLLDGRPDSKEETERVLINYVNTLQSSDEALIMFVQIGDEAEAYDWLKTGLDEGLRAKFDIVYTVTSKEFGNFPSLLAMFSHALAQNK